MRYLIPIMILFSLIIPSVATAQAPSNEWDIGWESDDEVEIMILDSSYNFNLVIEFWVDNSRPVPANLEFVVETNEDFTVDDPGSASVDANTNESFEITITGSGLDELNELIDARAQHYDIVTLTANLMVGEQSSDSKEIEKKVQFSPVYQFTYPSIDDVNADMKAGTDKEVTIEIANKGNVDDAIKRIQFSFKGCPQMDYQVVSGLQTGTVISDKTSGVIKLLSPSSHPDKTCTFEVSTVSEGSNLGYVGSFTFDVDAPEKVSNNDGNSGDTNVENTENSAAEDNSLPFVPFSLSILTVIFAAFVRR